MLSWSLLNRFAVPVIVLAVLLTLAITARAIWYFVMGPAQVSFGNEILDIDQAPSAQVSVQSIVNANLFGNPKKTDSRPTRQLEDTKLKLKLIAVFESFDDDQKSSAFIVEARSGASIKRYYEDDSIASIATIEEIQSSQVILNRGGNRERLSFVDSPIFVANKQAIDSLPASNQSQPDAEELPIFDSSEITQDLMNLRKLAKVGESGTIELTIGDDKPSDMMRQFGLRSGDQIISVNNVPTGQLQSSEQLQALLAKQEGVRIEIQRGKSQFFLSLPPP